jgi:hypothetical protein
LSRKIISSSKPAYCKLSPHRAAGVDVKSELAYAWHPRSPKISICFIDIIIYVQSAPRRSHAPREFRGKPTTDPIEYAERIYVDMLS